MTAVLDASAVLSLLLDEPGAAAVSASLDVAVLSVVSLAEVLTKLADRGVETAGIARDLRALGMRLEPVVPPDAEAQLEVRAADLDAHGGRPLLSLADRLCLAAAWRLDARVVTADRAWTGLDLPVAVELVR